MKRFLSRALAVLLCFALLSAGMPAMLASAAAGDGIVTYRALLVGNAKYDNGQTLQGPAFDVQHIRQLLLQQDFSGRGFAPSDIITLSNATKLQILNTVIKKLASKADGDDVTYFYYSGHGMFDGTTSYIVGSEMGLVSIDEVKAVLDKVQGRKVVMLDSCYSGGFTGRGVGSDAVQGSKWKDTGASGEQKDAVQADGLAAFQAGVLKPFNNPQGLMQRAAMTTSSYKVIAAASPFQYSYEYQFNSRYGAPCYGPEFRMNGADYAGGPNNYSGEFTGMLVAGAGCVEFSSAFPEIKALADVNRDRKITLEELYRYLRGAVLYSTVQVYPEGDQTDVFEHSAADTPDWGDPALYAIDNGGPHSPGASSPVLFDVLSSNNYPGQVTIRRSLKIGDNRYADNAGVDISDVAILQPAQPAPEGADETVSWDGTASDGSQAGDGWYFAGIGNGKNIYPPVPFELQRGVSNFPKAAALPVNAAFSASLAAIGSKRWYSFTPGEDGLFRLQSTNGQTGRDPEAELFDEGGNSLAWSGDITLPSGDNDCNFELLRYLTAGQTYYVSIGLDDGSNAAISAFSRYTVLSPNNTLTKADTSKTSYTLFRPDTSGLWTIKAKSAYDDDNPGITLYDTWFDKVAMGERGPESYRYICVYLEAGRTYILETPAVPASMQVAAYGPGKAPAPAVSSMAALNTSAGAAVSIAHAYDTKYFRFTPAATGTYRFYSTSPVDGGGYVDSYAFLLDGKGAALASDDDLNYSQRKLQFSFQARLSAGIPYVLAVRAYVPPGRLTAGNPTLDFTVHVNSTGPAAQTQAVSAIAAGSGDAAALYDDNGALSDGMGQGGLLAGWGSGTDAAYDGLTGFDFGEGLYMLRRWTPELLYTPGGTAFTRLWSVGDAFVARDSARGYYAWGIGADGSPYEAISRLDNAANGLGNYNITRMAQGLSQNEIYFLDGSSGGIYSMADLSSKPAVLSAGKAYADIAVTSGSFFALDRSGTLWAMGANRYGECGNGGTSEVSNLTAVALPESIIQFAAGDNHVVALGKDGQVFTWGCNDSGSLGLGRTERVITKPAAVYLKGLLSTGESIARVFAGGGCSAVLASAGRVLAWGANDYGQLGVGSTFSQAGPVFVKALASSALGSGRKISSVVFGPESSYAIATDGSVYVSGRNNYNQLGFVSNDVSTFTLLSQPVLKSSNNMLQSLAVSAGKLSPAFNPETLEYTVTLPKGVATSTITAVSADSTATVKIDGQAVTSKTVNAGSDPVRTRVTVTAQNGTTQTYVLNFLKSPSDNAFLSSLTVSSGCKAPLLNQSSTSYSISIPETVSGPVTITPVPADRNAVYTIDGAKLKSKTVSLSINQTVTVKVEVTAQLGNKRTYAFTISRKSLLAGFTGSPVYSGYASLSPGGTDRLKFSYTLNAPATVKLEVRKGIRWYTVLKRAEATAGGKTFSWDGKISGRSLVQGAYSVRITPYYAGVAGAVRTMTVKILLRPAITMTSIYPAPFTVNGTNTQRIAFRWSRISDVKVEVISSSGRSVRTLYSQPNKAPATLTLNWDGRSNEGALLPAGYYSIRMSCGGSTLYKQFRIKR